MATASRPQRTIASETEVRGIGFFHGSDVTLRYRPAPADTGIVFVRTDLPGQPSVRAHIDHVVHTPRRTTIRQGEAVVEMVEHVMAALAGLRIDNCLIEIDAPETPGLDGSSLAHTEALLAAGIVEQDRPRSVYVIDRPVTVREGQAVLTAHPGEGDGFILSYQLDYGRETPIGAQSYFLQVTPETFARELASSRTFLLQSEAQVLRDAGIGRRTNASDLLIFGPEGIVGNELRHPDECARHKILDMVGDLALLGQDIHGHVVAHRSGHSLNAALVRALVEAASTGHDDLSTVSLACLEDAYSAVDLGPILSALPNRYPFPMVDRVLTIDRGRRLTAVKNLSFNEPFFPGPASSVEPVMPGVMILEALAQAAGILLADVTESDATAALLAGIESVRIQTPVGPGDQLRLDIRCVKLNATGAIVRGVATVSGMLAAEATFQFAATRADRSAA